MELRTISDIKKLNKDAGLHFFDADTMEFFASIVYPHIRRLRDGALFITSEKYESLRAPANHGDRLFTVRRISSAGKTIECSKFQEYKTLQEARTAMKEWEDISEVIQAEEIKSSRDAIVIKKSAEQSHESRELEIYINNDQPIYKHKVECFKNLTKKKVKGTYKAELAAKLMRYVVDAGAKKYCVEFGNGVNEARNIFTGKVRNETAAELVKDFESAYDLKEYNFMQ